MEFVLRAAKMEDFGCFCMTEMGHGSNVRGVETIAEYDPLTKEYVFNSPTETSRKFWIGGLAKTANMAVVFAQLWSRGVNHGPHVFLIPIRERASCVEKGWYEGETYEGVEIGDCGDKNEL